MARSLDIPEFFAPLPLAAVGLMYLNDNLLKHTFHNALTGEAVGRLMRASSLAVMLA